MTNNDSDLSSSAASIEGLVERLEEWLTRYGQILTATDKLLHEIRYCSNADELWRMVGFSQEVEDLHTRVLYELDKAEEALEAAALLRPSRPSGEPTACYEHKGRLLHIYTKDSGDRCACGYSGPPDWIASSPVPERRGADQ